MAPIREPAESAINKVKYSGEMASTVCQLEYSIISSVVFSKNNEARKYPKKPSPLPVNERIHKAVKKSGRIAFSFCIVFTLEFTAKL